MNATAAPAVQTRFEKDDARTYTVDGVKTSHARTLLCEVTAMDATTLTYTVLEVIYETGRPAWATDVPQGGTLAAFGWDAGVAAGRIRPVR